MEGRSCKGCLLHVATGCINLLAAGETASPHVPLGPEVRVASCSSMLCIVSLCFCGVAAVVGRLC